jgi:hypothetical protein
MKLRDCILLKPGSTVYNTFEALKKGALQHVIVHGDFVRAEGRNLDTAENNVVARKRQLGRDDKVGEDCCVLRIQTNRKSVWQHQMVTHAAVSTQI